MTKLELEKIAVEVRKGIITGVHSAKSGHPGGSLSAAEIFTYLYFVEMNVDPKNPKIRTETDSSFPKDMLHQVCMRHWHRKDISR